MPAAAPTGGLPFPTPARPPPRRPSYRVGISCAALGTAGGALAAAAGADALLDPLAAVGAAGLGASVFLIHVYVDPLKKLLQVRGGARGGVG
jgi:hypothetical protein